MVTNTDCAGCQFAHQNVSATQYCWLQTRARRLMRQPIGLRDPLPWNQPLELRPNCYTRPGVIYRDPPGARKAVPA